MSKKHENITANDILHDDQLTLEQAPVNPGKIDMVQRDTRGRQTAQKLSLSRGYFFLNDQFY